MDVFAQDRIATFFLWPQNPGGSFGPEFTAALRELADRHTAETRARVRAVAPRVVAFRFAAAVEVYEDIAWVEDKRKVAALVAALQKIDHRALVCYGVEGRYQGRQPGRPATQLRLDDGTLIDLVLLLEPLPEKETDAPEWLQTLWRLMDIENENRYYMHAPPPKER